ncbi:unnamed protein product [Dibothriocephalus latus]|uniref:Uncharacterized protein n=1 Tax=Dibothriocephalus latus TaxID=60516 RepID=A0A3P7NQB6_DIBLA|nr:unnamed protein product [Dibothriocephalus latus]
MLLPPPPRAEPLSVLLPMKSTTLKSPTVYLNSSANQHMVEGRSPIVLNLIQQRPSPVLLRPSWSLSFLSERPPLKRVTKIRRW